MTAFHTVWFGCDAATFPKTECDANFENPNGWSEEYLARRARKEGWEIIDGLHYCPEHAWRSSAGA